MLHHVPRCVALLACCGPLLGCAVGGDPGPAAAADRTARFEGWYQGRQVPSSAAGSTCRARPRWVWFAVEDGIIEKRSSPRRRGDGRRRTGLWGTVSADGGVAMRQADGKRSAVGRIEGDRLTAADVQDARAIQGAAGGRAPCAYRYEATRVGPSGPGGGGDALGAAPPVERLAQP